MRAALAQVLPTATQHRKVGLITYGPGPYNQCNVKLDLKPTPNAANIIMSAVNALVPAGKTPLTSAVEQAAEVLNYRSKPGVIVVVTDGEETCGGRPCELAKQLNLAGDQLTVHVIAFRYEGFSWTGGNSVMDLMCLADENSWPLCQGQLGRRTDRRAGEDAGLSDDLGREPRSYEVKSARLWGVVPMRGIVSLVFILLAAVWLGTASAENQTLLDRCWTPQVLAGTASELKALRAHHKLDLAALKQEPLPGISPVPPELRGSIRERRTSARARS